MRRLLFFLCSLPLLATAEPDLREQLRDALYSEEVDRDPAKAAEAYQKILTDFDQQRPLAASALFRLAEVRRKQEKNDKAIALYQRLLREFSDFERESELAREHLATLGGKITEAGESSPEDKQLAFYKKLKESNPDRFLAPETLKGEISSGNLRIIRYLLENGHEPNTPGVLTEAAEFGYLEVCKLLFEFGCSPDKREAGSAIFQAVRKTSLPTLTFLLDQRLDPNLPYMVGDQSWQPLNSSIHSGDLKTAALLIEHGAEVNAFDRSGQNSAEGTPLHIAATDGNLGAVQLLLKHEAKPDLPSPDGAVTPLHLAVQSSKDSSLEIVNLLLEKGADLKLRTTKDLMWWPNSEQLQSATPLDISLRTNQPEKVKALLAAGAEVTTVNLITLADRKKSELFALLLDHTPDFTPDDPIASKLLETAAKEGVNIAPLLTKGARPSKQWIEADFPSASGSNYRLLKLTFAYPDLASNNDVILIRTKWWNEDELLLSLADQSQDPELPSMARALLDSDISSTFIFFNNDGDTENDELETRWTLWRKNRDGTLTPTVLDLSGDDDLPDLQWGDLIELTTLGVPVARDGHSPNAYVTKSPSTYWNLLRRISFPIKVTRGDEISEITVRGDCLSYDPTKSAVPLLPAGSLSQLLYPNEYHQALSKPLELIVYREGWDPIRLSCNTKEWAAFPLQANDRISVEAELDNEEHQLSLRKKQIRLTVPDTQFSRYRDIRHEPELLPMLSELITETYAAWDTYGSIQISGLAEDPQTRFGQIAYSIQEQPEMMPIALPHPDFSAIRIRRLQENGSETIITSRLAESIADFTNESTREQLAEEDLRLQPGDIVELPLKESSEPWTGFSEQATRYFHHRLSGAFMLTDDQGKVSRKTINWQPADYLPSPCGPIAFQPEKGTASTTAFSMAIYNSNLLLRRDGDTFDGVSSRGLFIRDSDQLAPGQPRPTIRKVTPQPGTNSSPRVRRVPTPPSP